jgi:hypothetical protein
VSTDARRFAAAWHTADVGLGAGAAAAEVGAGGALGDGLLVAGDEVLLELQAAKSSPAAKAAAARRHRPGRVTVARIAFASSSKPQPPATPAADCAGPIAIVLPLSPRRPA